MSGMCTIHGQQQVWQGKALKHEEDCQMVNCVGIDNKE